MTPMGVAGKAKKLLVIVKLRELSVKVVKKLNIAFTFHQKTAVLNICNLHIYPPFGQARVQLTLAKYIIIYFPLLHKMMMV